MEEREYMPFNLELARQGYPVKTKDGRKVRIVCFDHQFIEGYFKMIALITTEDGRPKKWGKELETLMFYSVSGKVSLLDVRPPDNDDWNLEMGIKGIPTDIPSKGDIIRSTWEDRFKEANKEEGE